MLFVKYTLVSFTKRHRIMAISSNQSLIVNVFVSRTVFTNKNNAVIMSLGLILFGSILLAISAQYKVPLGPVPITLQTLVVMLIGTLYGMRLGALTVIAYWIEGVAIGGVFSFIPWFANGSGILYFTTSPSAGFLWGFLPMVLIISFLNDQCSWRNNPLTIVASLLLGQAALYGVGLSHAYIIVMPYVAWMNSGSEMLNIYIYPFITGDAIKTAIAACLTAQAVWIARRKKI